MKNKHYFYQGHRYGRPSSVLAQLGLILIQIIMLMLILIRRKIKIKDHIIKISNHQSANPAVS